LGRGTKLPRLGEHNRAHFGADWRSDLGTMFTAKPQKNRQAATTYFDEHLSHNDYYTEKQSQAGYWIGAGAELLGLQPGEVVTREAFLRLCDNRHPVEGTGVKLTQVHLRDRRIFFDFTCSAPKSVSILAVTMEDRRVVEAHREAASIALRELEAFAATRIRKNGAMDDRVTGNLVGAAFEHTSSRALDPQLHTHFTLFNATRDPAEKRWKALQTSGMFGAIHYATAVYRNELSARLHRLGYDTRQTAHGFEIEGVRPDIIERFSKRAQQRNAAVAREEKKLGRKLSHNEVSHVVHQSRPRKLKNASEAAVRKAQLDEIGFFEKRALRAVVAQSRAVVAEGKKQDFRETVHLGAAMDHGIQHAFSRQSVVQEHELLEAALVKGCGQLELAELRREFQRDSRLVRVGAEYSTREILGTELAMIRHVNRGLNVAEPIAPRHRVAESLGADQRAALKLVLSSPDRITGMQGLAGAGKTTALRELHAAVRQSGRELIVCAPSAAATDVLRKEGFAEAVTVAKLLTSDAPLSPRSVLVVDEAGTLGTADMLRVFVVAREARVVLVGDTGQHAPVAQGDALRIIEDHSGYRFGRLTEIRRQRSEDLKQTVALAAKQQTREAFARLVRAGEVVERGDTAALHQKAADDYLRVTQSGKTALFVSPTWAEIEAVTEAIRQKLREEKQLAAKEEKVRVFDPVGWTDAQKRLVAHYEPGLQLRFVRRSGEFKAGESVEVFEQRGRQLRVRDDHGRERSFFPARAPSSFDVGQKRELGVAAGDVLLLRANAPGFVNGERVVVKAAQRERITLTDGRELPREYRTFSHGYAVTSHAAQGKTVDQVMVVASSESFAAVSQEQFYVSISRARERARIYTDDTDLLGRRVEDTHTRKAAIELEGLREALKRAGYTRAQTPAPAMRPDSPRASVAQTVGRAWRHVRELRAERLAPAQRLAQRWTQSLRQWLGERLGHRVERTQRMTAREFIDQAQREAPRQSRGIRM